MRPGALGFLAQSFACARRARRLLLRLDHYHKIRERKNWNLETMKMRLVTPRMLYTKGSVDLGEITGTLAKEGGGEKRKLRGEGVVWQPRGKDHGYRRSLLLPTVMRPARQTKVSKSLVTPGLASYWSL